MKEHEDLSQHHVEGDLYPFITPTSQPSVDLVVSSYDMWHNHADHIGPSILDFLRSHLFILCNEHKHFLFVILVNLQIINVCHFMSLVPLRLAPFDIINCNLWASPITSKASYKNYIVLIDNYIQYVWVY